MVGVESYMLKVIKNLNLTEIDFTNQDSDFYQFVSSANSIFNGENTKFDVPTLLCLSSQTENILLESSSSDSFGRVTKRGEHLWTLSLSSILEEVHNLIAKGSIIFVLFLPTNNRKDLFPEYGKRSTLLPTKGLNHITNAFISYCKQFLPNSSIEYLCNNIHEEVKGGGRHFLINGKRLDMSALIASKTSGNCGFCEIINESFLENYDVFKENLSEEQITRNMPFLDLGFGLTGIKDEIKENYDKVALCDFIIENIKNLF